MTTEILVYMTAPTREVAERIASSLIETRLAACANMIEGMTSVYRWEGAVCSEREVVLLAKTRSQLFEPLADHVKSIHPYSCPCIVAVPIADGYPPFLQWIRESCK